MNNIDLKTRNRISFIYSLLKPFMGVFWLLVVLMIFAAAWEGVVLATAATLFQTLVDTTKFSSSTFKPDSLIGELYSYFLLIPDEYHLVAGFTFTAIAILIGVLINASLHTFQTSFSTRFIIHVRCEIFYKLYRSSLTYFDKQKKGALLAMVVNESRSCYAIVKNFLQLLISLTRTLVLFGILNTISLELTFIVAIISGIFLAEIWWVARIQRRLSEKYVEKNRAMTVDVDESLQGVKLVKLFNLHNIMESSFRNNCSIAEFTSRKQAVIMQWQAVVSSIFMISSVFILIFSNVIFSFTVISLMVTFLYTLQKLYGSLLSVNKAYSVLNREIPGLDRVIEFFNKHDVFIEKSGNLVREKLLNQKLSFKGVNLSYRSGGDDQYDNEKNELILENIDLDIYKGETIAIVGESGSGKSSLVNLIVRLYDPSKGQIFIDGDKIQKFDLYFLRKNIGIVNQDTILFNRSIRENIMFGWEEASEEEMIQAAKNAHVHEFVMMMSKGYDALIGDRGVMLSGGQRQRINLAQIFLKKPEIMIMDEATSALDTKSEQYIKESIEKLSSETTNIIIAHRLSTIRNADKVVVLNNGRIIEKGDWESLMEAKGVFNEMVKLQQFVKQTNKDIGKEIAS